MGSELEGIRKWKEHSSAALNQGRDEKQTAMVSTTITQSQSSLLNNSIFSCCSLSQCVLWSRSAPCLGTAVFHIFRLHRYPTFDHEQHAKWQDRVMATQSPTWWTKWFSLQEQVWLILAHWEKSHFKCLALGPFIANLRISTFF